MENKAEPNMEPADVRRRIYNRQYYHENKRQVQCVHCGNEYSCVSGLVKHQRRSQKCKVIKLQKYIDEMDGQSHFGIPEKELFANIITRLETA